MPEWDAGRENSFYWKMKSKISLVVGLQDNWGNARNHDYQTSRAIKNKKVRVKRTAADILAKKLCGKMQSDKSDIVIPQGGHILEQVAFYQGTHIVPKYL